MSKKKCLILCVYDLSRRFIQWTEACPAVGHKGHIPLKNPIRRGHMPLLVINLWWNLKEYVLPLNTRKGQTLNYSLSSYNLLSCPIISCLWCPRGKKPLKGGRIFPALKWNLPLLKKIRDTTLMSNLYLLC